MERLLVLLRHGESEWNAKNVFTGWKDPDLSLRGVEEAEAAGQLIRAAGLRFGVAFTSALKRAQRTLDIVLKELGQPGIPIVRDQALNERDYGDLTGMNKDEARARWDKETDVNLGIGLTYRFASNWSFGWEFEHEREFSRLIFWNGKYATNVAYYTGPTLHYGGESFFATLTFLEQLPWGQDYADQNVMKGGINYADDFEKFRVRLKVGVNF